MDTTSIKNLFSATAGPASLRYRGLRGVIGAAAWILVLWVLRTFVLDLPQAMDQAFWPFTWMVAFAIFFWLLVR